MERKDILRQMNDIFIDVLDDDSIVLKETMTAHDVEEWDSLNHIQLVIAIEKHFNVRFTSVELSGLANVGDMCTAIEKKVAGNAQG